MSAAGIRRVARGFTMVEAIATLTVLGVLASVSANLIYTATTSYRDAATRAQLSDEVSVAMDRIARRLTSIDRDTGAALVAPEISSVTPTSIVWNGNYSLTLTAGQLLLVENGGTSRVLLDNVTAFSVSAFNESNGALAGTLSGAATQPIRRLRVQVTVQRVGVSETVRTKLFIRSTMSGAKIG
jgi:prepilin-type N-terminal cleavage/methylation domain-containing protein